MDLLSYCFTSAGTNPLGDIHINYKNDAIYSLTFAQCSDGALRELNRRLTDVKIRSGEEPKKITAALNRYLHGDTYALHGLQIYPQGCSFQQRVWRKLGTIQSGTTVTYGQLAQLVGCPAGSQVLAEALRTNPVQMIVPCHRIVGSHGVHVDYGGGLDRKVWLNKHEHLNTQQVVAEAA